MDHNFRLQRLHSHVFVSPGRAGQQEDILKQLRKIVYSYGLNHMTLQVELSAADCGRTTTWSTCRPECGPRSDEGKGPASAVEAKRNRAARRECPAGPLLFLVETLTMGVYS